MRETRDLIHFWRTHSVPETRFILATLTETEGSTYRKAGAQKLITSGRQSQGILSGGCLEGEIIDRALEFLELRKVDESAMRTVHVFDTSNESDRFFGYQKGCRGKLTIEFNEVGPFDAAKAESLFKLHSGRIVIFGAGADAVPVSELFHFMGWEHFVIDHRRDMAVRELFPYAAEVLYESAETSARHLRPGDRVVIMTHNFEADMHLLKGIAAFGQVSYIGILGPRVRFEQLQADLKNILHTELAPEFVEKIRSPIGLNLNSTHPSEIALAIAAEIQFKGRSLFPTPAWR